MLGYHNFISRISNVLPFSHDGMREIKIELGRSCCRSVQFLFSYRSLSKQMNNKARRTIILPVLYRYEMWPVTLREECLARSVQE